MMLDRLHHLARRLGFLRKPVLWALFLVLLVLAWLFLGGSGGAADIYQIPVILLLLWLLTLLAFINLFAHVPAGPEAGAPWLRRWGQRLKRLAYGLLALLMAALSLAMLIVSAQLVSAWFRMY